MFLVPFAPALMPTCSVDAHGPAGTSPGRSEKTLLDGQTCRQGPTRCLIPSAPRIVCIHADQAGGRRP